VIDSTSLIDALGESLLGPEVDLALRNALHQGATSPDGQHISGLDELRANVRDELNERFEQLPKDDLERILDGAQKSGTGESISNSEQLGQLIKALKAGLDPSRLAVRQFDTEALDSIGNLLEELARGAIGSGAPQDITDELRDIGDLLSLETKLARASDPADVLEIDQDRVQHLLQDDAMASVTSLASGLVQLRSDGFIVGSGRNARLSPTALRRIGRQLLQEAFQAVDSRTAGAHSTFESGTPGTERGDTTRDYKYGDRFDPDLSASLLRAARRASGVPVQVQPDDFQIFEPEGAGRAALAICVDTSRSMEERGFLAATRRAALSVGVLVSERYPRDDLQLVAFSNEARSINHVELSALTWDRHQMGTNIQDALRVAREGLTQHREAHKSVLLITDGEPTAHRDHDKEIIFAEPASEEALAATFAEGARLRKAGIDLHIMLLSRDKRLTNFARQLASHAGGRVWLTDPQSITPLLAKRYRRSI
ncbi:MAG: VWA domain-containing protein, partial [Chloroflexota bacterium]